MIGPTTGQQLAAAIRMIGFFEPTNAARREAEGSDPVPETALDEGLISDTGAFCFNPPFPLLLAL